MYVRSMGGTTDDSEISTRAASGGDVRESCDRCGHETPHEVRIEIRTESSESENAEYSREPYRVSTCIACGGVSITRMNDA